MSYIRKTWIENETKLSAENMNRMEDGIEEALYKSEGNASMWEYIRDLVYPVGSIYMSVNNTNPGSLFGGTWVAWGSGKVPVGVNVSDSDFSTVEFSGGAKTVTLTAAQSGLREHSHSFTQPTVPAHSHGFTQPKISSHKHDITANKYNLTTGATSDLIRVNVKNGTGTVIGNVVTSPGGAISRSTPDTGPATPTASGGAVQTRAAMTTTGGAVTKASAAAATSAHTNLQPYITCYMWKRTG